jgi:hypothetical protein
VPEQVLVVADQVALLDEGEGAVQVGRRVGVVALVGRAGGPVDQGAGGVVVEPGRDGDLVAPLQIVAPAPVAELEAGEKGTGRTAVEVSGPGLDGRSQPVTYTVTGTGTESVTVPAGTAEAYVVALDLDLGAGFAGVTEASGKFWLKPGFGLVKQEITISGLTLTSELAKSSVPL